MKALSTAAVSLALALCACGGSPGPAAAGQDRSSPRAARAPDAGTAAPTRAAIPTQLAYTYNPMGKRDPFREPEEVRRTANVDGANACDEPLCQWELDELDLKAVVTGDANPFAMLEDPKGRGHIVRRNQRVGRSGGKVTQILRDSITVTEYWTQPDGKRAAVPKDKKIVEDKNFEPATDLRTGQVYQ